jgi:predicted GNAT family N-acyltransferase
MNFKIIKYQSKEYEQMINLRTEVLRKPLGLVYTEQQLAMDKEDILIGCFDAENADLLACCILTIEDEHTMKLRQMAVDNNLQGQGIGSKLISFTEKVAKEAGYNKIELHARKYAEGFYQKLGYSVVGDEFFEVNIPHFKMEKYFLPIK